MILGLKFLSLLSRHVYVSSFECSVFAVEHLLQRMLSETANEFREMGMTSYSTIYFNDLEMVCSKVNASFEYNLKWDYSHFWRLYSTSRTFMRRNEWAWSGTERVLCSINKISFLEQLCSILRIESFLFGNFLRKLNRKINKFSQQFNTKHCK